jgi:hypothetical protein
MSAVYQTESEIVAVVLGFESCHTAKENFPHQSHLTVAVWYLRNSSFEQATEKMRMGLLRFLDNHGVPRQKFHETLTSFWMRMIDECLRGFDSSQTLIDVTNSVIEALGDPRLVWEYYSCELLNSDRARNGWVEPDLKHL